VTTTFTSRCTLIVVVAFWHEPFTSTRGAVHVSVAFTVWFVVEVAFTTGGTTVTFAVEFAWTAPAYVLISLP
jgi:hypothetical protein